MKKIYLFSLMALVMASLTNCKKTADADLPEQPVHRDLRDLY